MTWYLWEEMPAPYQNSTSRSNSSGPIHAGWRGVMHAVRQDPTPPHAIDQTFLLKPERIKTIADGTSKTLLIGESTNRNSIPSGANTEFARRSLWAYSWGNYSSSQTTPQARTLWGDYGRCTATETGTWEPNTLDGQPLPGVHMVFFPKSADPRTGRLFVADTDAEGRFSVGAIEWPQGGIPPGSYRLALTTAYSATAGDDEPPPSERVPATYRTGIAFEVPSGGTRDAAIELKSK